MLNKLATISRRVHISMAVTKTLTLTLFAERYISWEKCELRSGEETWSELHAAQRPWVHENETEQMMACSRVSEFPFANFDYSFF